MDISGFTEKGFKRKLAVQVLFAKILYLSEVLFGLKFFLLLDLNVLCNDTLDFITLPTKNDLHKQSCKCCFVFLQNLVTPPVDKSH